MSQELLIGIIGGFITVLLGLTVYIFNEMKNDVKNMSSEMSGMNKQLVKLITNQEWQYKSIVKLQSDVEVLQGKRGIEV